MIIIMALVIYKTFVLQNNYLVHLKMVRLMENANYPFQMVLGLQENMQMELEKVMENGILQMGVSLKVNIMGIKEMELDR